MKYWKPNWIFALLLVLNTVVAFAGDSGARISLELRSPGSSGAPLLVTDDFADASVTPAGEHSALNLTLTDAGAAKLRSFTATHVGGKLDFVVDGKLRSAPLIRQAITDGRVSVTFLPEKDALALARSIHQKAK